MKLNFLLLYCFFPILSLAQITQIGDYINGHAEGEGSGHSVSLNESGNIVAIGGPWSNGNGNSSGHVRVYQNIENSWIQMGADINGEAEDRSGHSVSINTEGNIVAIGAPSNNANGSLSGTVRVYQNIDNIWLQIGANINGEAAFNESGSSISLNSQGNILVIGAHGSGYIPGYTRVFLYSNGSWNQLGQNINGEAIGDGFGGAVDVNADGSIIAIGAQGNGGNGIGAGHVRVFKNLSNSWIQLGADIEGESEYDYSGRSVSLSADGSILAIGAPNNRPIGGFSSGHVRVYRNIGGSWSQIGADIDGEVDDIDFGQSVSLNDDGKIIAIGAPKSFGAGNLAGRAKLFQNIADNWTQIGENIEAEDIEELSGFSVSLNSNGNIVAVGAINGHREPIAPYVGHVRVLDATNLLNLDDTSLPYDLAVYPSPTSGILNIKSETSITKISIFNQLGQLVKSYKGQKSIDISSLTPSLYFIKLYNENVIMGIFKIIKK